ncbi:uncharacterized protein FOMMEDRAFT_145530 [Fomitiporia mediterranea MF3/22]|uniref:uncharacterized protein n=1 Tax=Fomitiporia mediterranea (strain MF3/22) TaxID=694068 RepID=UPI0004407F7D|nr:uncharacterized protein FOMMEDRAFT_145530 [Fomitiporia mediterranea MF3/22]EJD04703.1 hypothetical protein FOMMEDRAFT_145530 [Fomitiporia mediterranea MF3/22]
MGPPSRYNLYSTSRSRTQSSQDCVPAENEIDTASLSNAELAKHYLKSFATAATPEEFASRADAVLSRSVNITINGSHLSRALYAQQWGASFGATGRIFFNGVLETPNVTIPTLRNAALVGILYEATFTTPTDRLGAVHGSAQQVTISVSSTINLTIAEDKTLPSSCRDRRRIVSVNQALVDKDGFLVFPLRDL